MNKVQTITLLAVDFFNTMLNSIGQIPGLITAKTEVAELLKMKANIWKRADYYRVSAQDKIYEWEAR